MNKLCGILLLVAILAACVRTPASYAENINTPIADISGLPPDPSDAGKVTIEGIDSDHDGVRDDVQRFIAGAYPDSPKIQLLLTYVAKNKLSALRDANDTALSRQHALEAARLIDCMSDVLGSNAPV